VKLQEMHENLCLFQGLRGFEEELNVTEK